MFKKPCFRKPFEGQHAKAFETLLTSAWKLFYDIAQSLWKKSSWKMSPLVICEILGLSVNPLIVDDKYSLRNRENLQ